MPPMVRASMKAENTRPVGSGPSVTNSSDGTHMNTMRKKTPSNRLQQARTRASTESVHSALEKRLAESQQKHYRTLSDKMQTRYHGLKERRLTVLFLRLFILATIVLRPKENQQKRDCSQHNRQLKWADVAGQI